MKIKGLIPGQQQKDVFLDADFWEYGIIKDNVKKIDPLLHYGCFVLGYKRHDILDYVCQEYKKIKPEIAEVMSADEDLRLNHVSFQLADKLFDITCGYRSFYALSGSDANEGAIKLASAYQAQKNNQDKNTIISFYQSYHGSTLLTSSLGCDSLDMHPFYNMSPYSHIKRIPRNFDISDVDWDKVSAITVETCSYGPLTPSTNEFWGKISYIQKTYDVLLIIDDIFMGGGKTGSFVGWENLPVKPDIFTMGKSITAGAFPLSLVLYNKKVHDSMPPEFIWEHGFTYNYSIPGVLSVLKYFEILEEENILNQYEYIKTKAIDTFTETGIDIINNFGLYFRVNLKSHEQLYLIPSNASDEYFEVLKNDLHRI